MIKKIIRVLFIDIPVHIIMLITSVLPNLRFSNKIRGFFLRPFFKKAGKNLQIASGVIINHIHNVTIGNNVYIAHNVWINGTAKINIEDNVKIGPYSVIVTSEHKFNNGEVSNDEYTSAPIFIGKGTWVASHVVITNGISIGKGCLIAAGAVVTKDVSDNVMVGGVPAKFIKEVTR